MAVESWTDRVTRRLTEAALRLRQPARRFAGSVRSAVSVGAIIIGAYTLLIGSILINDPWRYRNVSALLQTSSAFAFLTSIMDIALLFGILVREDKILKYVLCTTMALYLVAIPLSVITFFTFAVLGYFPVPLWEVPRFGGCLLHLGLMYCLLSELRGDPLPPLSPAGAPAEGWLKNNLARTGPPAPTASDDALLKVHVAHDNDHAHNNNNAQPRGPAVFAPSSCTTAPPVPPPYAADAAPGPPSSTDA